MQKKSKYQRLQYKMDDLTVPRCIFCDKVKVCMRNFPMPPLGKENYPVCSQCLHPFTVLKIRNIDLWE